ncbi:MAG: MerR family transcriptional regulator [Chitinophagaceae bacterium]|nr:MerR family transcriptional regulator [Chitinophagaceae bacterium]
MQDNEIVILNEFCTQHQVDITFIYALHNSGLIEVTVTDEQICIPEQQLPNLEKMVRLYYEMGINVEGIETINHLLNRMNEMQELVNELNNRLGFYEKV